MVWTETSLANLALANLFSTAFISDIQTEQSTEANLCRQFMPMILQEAFSRYRWSFNKKVATLGLVAERPSSEWLYAYAMPAESIDFRRIHGDSRVLTSDTLIRCDVGLFGDDDRLVVFTDRESAVGEYSIVPPLSVCPADFVRAASYSLASALAPGITAGSRTNMSQQMFGMYETLAFQAATRDSNQITADQPADAESIRARGGW